MTRPIEKAIKFKEFCRYIEILSYEYMCELENLGRFDEPCNLEDWARCPFNPESKDTTDPKSSYIYVIKNLEFDSRGKFYYGCHRYFKKLKKDVDPIIPGLDLDDSAQRREAWLKVIEKFGGQPIGGG